MSFASQHINHIHAHTHTSLENHFAAKANKENSYHLSNGSHVLIKPHKYFRKTDQRLASSCVLKFNL